MRPTARAVPPRRMLTGACVLATSAAPAAPAAPARAERSYAARNPLVSGHWRHWRPRRDGTGGPAAAAGPSSVVSGPRAVPFGTAPLFRDHPKGEFAQLTRALFAVAAVRGSSVEENG